MTAEGGRPCLPGMSDAPPACCRRAAGVLSMEIDLAERVSAVDEEPALWRERAAEVGESAVVQLWVTAVECADADGKGEVER